MAAGYEVEEAVWPAVLLVSCQQSGIPHTSERSVERDGQQKRAVLPKRPVVMLRIVVIDKDRLCAQGKAGVPRLSAEIESIVEVGAFLSFGRLP